MNQKIRSLHARQTKAIAAAKAIAASVGANDIMSVQQAEEFDAYMREADNIAAQIQVEQAEQDYILTAPATPSDAPSFGRSPSASGFNGFGDYLAAIVNAGRHGGSIDDRLHYSAGAPTTFGNESSGADGGFLVPPDFSRDIFSVFEIESLLPRTRVVRTQGNSLFYPVDLDAPWDSTAGIHAKFVDEATAASQQKPKLTFAEPKLKKLVALVPVTDEVLEDSGVLAQWLPRKLGQAMSWRVTEMIVSGNGAGQPLGILNADALVSVAKETSQAADTLQVENLAKMLARALSPSGSVWIAHPSTLAQLIIMKLGDTPVWQPDATTSPAGTLFGRPLVLTDAAKPLGDKGDVILADLQSYLSIVKQPAPKIDQSMHLFFDAGATAFRATFRYDGQPLLSTAISPPNSAATRSPFVTLDERA